MPFQSKAQFRKFAMLQKEGKLPPGTLHRWMSETPNFKKLPQHKKKLKAKKIKKYGRKNKKNK